MTSGHLPPEAWGDAAVSWPDQFFAIRVTQEDDPERLEAAVRAEAEAKARKDRIARINERLADLRD